MNGFTDWDSELCHHGIKGQKWGIRRFQNEDGSLTAAGQKRYGDSKAPGLMKTVKNSVKEWAKTEKGQKTIKRMKTGAAIAAGVLATAAAGTAFLSIRNQMPVLKVGEAIVRKVLTNKDTFMTSFSDAVGYGGNQVIRDTVNVLTGQGKREWRYQQPDKNIISDWVYAKKIDKRLFGK